MTSRATWLRLVREPTANDATLGVLFVNGHFFSFTLEDEIREVVGAPVEQWKIPGVTAIPAGQYRVLLTMSQRFQRVLPLLLDVPGFSGVRVHPGNTHADTSGCVLVGTSRLSARLGGSKIAFELLMERVQGLTDLWISVENPPVFETRAA